jgi:hypothetical protein
MSLALGQPGHEPAVLTAEKILFSRILEELATFAVSHSNLVFPRVFPRMFLIVFLRVSPRDLLIK